jgi:hypothetical protein
MLARATHVKIVDGRIAGAHSVAGLQWNAVVRSAGANSGAQPALGRVTTTDRGELEVLAFAVAGSARATAAAADVLVVFNEPHRTPASAHDLLRARVWADGVRSARCDGQSAMHESASFG